MRFSPHLAVPTSHSDDRQDIESETVVRDGPSPQRTLRVDTGTGLALLQIQLDNPK